MSRSRVPWLVAVPLMAAGSFAARAATTVCVSPAGGETGSESAEHLRHGAEGIQWPLVIGVVLALAVTALVAQIVTVLAGRRARAASPWVFFALPPLAFVAQEIAERSLHTESGTGTVALGHLVLGLAMQLPFAAAAFALAFVLQAGAARIARTLESIASLPCTAAPAPRTPVETASPPPPTVLALGYPKRGPPIRS